MVDRHSKISAIAEGLELSKAFIQKEAEEAFLKRGVAVDPYPPQVEILNSRQKILALLGANRSGKTHTMMYKAAWDATGLYPDWYKGERTVRGIDAWLIGKTGQSTRDTAQRKLFGPNPEIPGWTDKPGIEGLIPPKYIVGKPTRQSAPAGLFDTIRIKHVPSDTISTFTFKSHSMDQGALASWHGKRVYIDEECPLEIMDELIARVTDEKGQIFIALCPSDGMTPTVKFLLNAPPDLVKVCYLTYDEAKHLDEAEKEANIRLWAHNPAMMLARTQGKVSTNQGLIFPFPTQDVLYDPSKVSISPYWPRLGGMDVGWTHPTAAVAGAWDPLSDVIYVYATYAQSERPALYHHAALQTWGANMTFMIDPAAAQVKEGVRVLEEYWKYAHGVDYEDIPEQQRKYIKADNAFQTGMGRMWHRFDTRRLLFRKDLRDLLAQYESYAWNKDGDGPRTETPDMPYDIITSVRYMVIDFEKYAHRLDAPPPWAAQLEWEEPIEIEDWKPYRAGGRTDD